jgi:hypothetical protein
MQEESKTLRVRKSTWERIRTHGDYGDDIDDIINRAFDALEESQE